jgi:hypothetical protein
MRFCKTVFKADRELVFSIDQDLLVPWRFIEHFLSTKPSDQKKIFNITKLRAMGKANY